MPGFRFRAVEKRKARRPELIRAPGEELSEQEVVRRTRHRDWVKDTFDGSVDGTTVVEQLGLFVTEAVIVVLAVVVITVDIRTNRIGVMVAWVAVVAMYVAIGTYRVRNEPLPSKMLAAHQHQRRSIRTLAVLRYSGLFACATSIFGMVAAASVLIATHNRSDQAQTVLGALLAIGSWVLLQSGYARVYAAAFYRAGGGLEFPNSHRPTPLDFAYFSFTMGTTFAVSDVNVTSEPMRYRTLGHCVVAFFYNSVVLGLALNVLT